MTKSTRFDTIKLVFWFLPRKTFGKSFPSKLRLLFSLNHNSRKYRLAHPAYIFLYYCALLYNKSMDTKAVEAIKKHYEEYRYMTKSELIAFILTQLDRMT